MDSVKVGGIIFMGPNLSRPDAAALRCRAIMAAAFASSVRLRELFYRQVVLDFLNATYTLASEAYRLQVGRLPGSERTARLRKKRRSKVLDWYFEKLEDRDNRTPQDRSL
ncbi:hypothetical protein [Anatilimnocola floriformis]|uniref:hypothetical protein n=1 Tax=Anatilimnocola floriformis TaxID=2948575 RepID=UPI0020C3A563|nr:hypothetical protein [Anatilimnocola floriformis]